MIFFVWIQLHKLNRPNHLTIRLLACFIKTTLVYQRKTFQFGQWSIAVLSLCSVMCVVSQNAPTVVWVLSPEIDQKVVGSCSSLLLPKYLNLWITIRPVPPDLSDCKPIHKWTSCRAVQKILKSSFCSKCTWNKETTYKQVLCKLVGEIQSQYNYNFETVHSFNFQS